MCLVMMMMPQLVPFLLDSIDSVVFQQRFSHCEKGELAIKLQPDDKHQMSDTLFEY
jgi:hypothetical protein